MEGKQRGRNKIIVQKLLHLSPVRKKRFRVLYLFVSSCITALRNYNIALEDYPRSERNNTLISLSLESPPETLMGNALFSPPDRSRIPELNYRVIPRERFANFRRVRVRKDLAVRLRRDTWRRKGVESRTMKDEGAGWNKRKDK